MSEAGFNRCWAIWVSPRDEGGALHTTPGDAGGATWDGITEATWDAWAAENPDLPRGLAYTSEVHRMTLFRVRFWQACLCDQADVGPDLMIVTIAGLAGPVVAARVVCAVLGCPEVHHISADMVVALSRAAVVRGADRVISDFADKFEAIAKTFRTAALFYKGWCNRMHNDAAAAMMMRHQVVDCAPPATTSAVA